MNVYTLQLDDEGYYQLNIAGNCIFFESVSRISFRKKCVQSSMALPAASRGLSMGKIIVVDFMYLTDMASLIVLTGTVDECLTATFLFCLSR